MPTDPMSKPTDSMPMPTDSMPMLSDSLGASALDYKETQDASMGSIAPKATKMFSKGAMNRLVKAFNKLKDAYGLQETYPDFTSDITVFPTEFVKLLSMVTASTQEAASQDVIEPKDTVSLDGIVKDTGVLMLASKLEALASYRPFKMWLVEAPSMDTSELAEEPVETDTLPAEAGGDPDLMGLLKQRMG